MPVDPADPADPVDPLTWTNAGCRLSGGRKGRATLTFLSLRARTMDLVHRIRDARQIIMTNTSNGRTY